jgi:hypothetical protein
MTKGILVGCDQHQEWMLQWWWTHYSRHNCYPVAFVDFGMSAEAKKWCQSKGHYIALDAPKNFVFPKSLISQDLIEQWEKVYGRELWQGREKWFYKPFSLEQTPFDETIWVDLDCEITGPLAPLFQKIHVHSKMALSALEVNRSTEEEVYNSGVIAYHRSSPLLAIIGQIFPFAITTVFLGDQDVLTFHHQHRKYRSGRTP